jgi:3-oxoacyl-[acyl-carrier protein] reductase
VLITGVSRGVGLVMARRLAQAGWTVYGTSRRESEAFAALRDAQPERIKFQAADLSEPEVAQTTLFGSFVSSTVVLHALVNNAAEAYDDLVTNLRVDRVTRMFATNVVAPMLLTKYAIRNMLLHQTAGAIVHVSSVSAQTGYKGLAMYAASKGALEAFSKNVAREWGGRGIRSNCVAPGFMDTEMSAALTAEQREKIYRRAALATAVDPESVAATVEFLLGDGAKSITGQTLPVDAGAI